MLIAGGVWYSRTHSGAGVSPEMVNAALLGDDVATVRRVMKKLIEEQTAPRAYETVKQIVSGIPQEQQHLAVHLIGESIYRTLGVEGVAVCDDAYGFGCYHGFFGTAIAAEGPETLVEFDKICVQKFGMMGLGCPHGIGHGLGEYYGPGRLSEQLAVCAKLSWQGERFGCSGGVFMEYNYPTTISGAKALTATRPFNPEQPYHPCTGVDSRFTKSCYLELAAWYYDVFSGDISRIQTLCAGITESAYKMECYRGLGLAVVPHMQYDVTKTRAACDKISDTAGRRWCYAGASWSFFAHPHYSSQAETVCMSLGKAEASQCKTEADLLGLIQN